VTDRDIEYFNLCNQAGFIKGSVLEVGAAKVQGRDNLCEICKTVGVVKTVGADLALGEGVDLVVDFGKEPRVFDSEWSGDQYDTVFVFNVLEHTFDPVTVLRNAMQCVAKGGSLIVVAPTVWPIHHFPKDHCRLLPDWFREFSRRNGMDLVETLFCWLSEFGVKPMDGDDSSKMPSFTKTPAGISWPRYYISRICHKLFNTYGRSHWATHSAIGATFVRR